jgi:hypothetical protein
LVAGFKARSLSPLKLRTVPSSVIAYPGKSGIGAIEFWAGIVYFGLLM